MMEHLHIVQPQSQEGPILSENYGEVVVVTSGSMPDGTVYLEPFNLQQTNVNEQLNILVQDETEVYAEVRDHGAGSQKSVKDDHVVSVASGLSVVKSEPVLIDHSYLPDKQIESTPSLESTETKNSDTSSVIQPEENPTISTIDSSQRPEKDSSLKYHYKIAYSIKEVREIIKRVEETTGVKFVTARSLKYFGMEDDWTPFLGDRRPNKTYGRITWHYGMDGKKEEHMYGTSPIPFDGVPFMHVSGFASVCPYADVNKILEKQKMIHEYRDKVAAGEIVHIEPPSKPRPPAQRQPKKGPILAEGMTVPNREPGFDRHEINMAAQTLEMMQSNQYLSGDLSDHSAFPFDIPPSHMGVPDLSPLKPRKPTGEPRKRIYKPRKKLPLPPGITGFRKTKKTGCRAALTIKQVAKFPEYKIPINKNSHNLMRRVSLTLREDLQKDYKSVKVQMTYYIRIPDIAAHYGHKVACRAPIYRSPAHVDYLLNHLYKFKDGKNSQNFADIRFNLEGQKRQLKLHSVILAASGTELRKSLLEGNYTHLAEILKPLDQVTLDTFVSFLYRGEMEIRPECDVEQLKEAFKMAGVKDGVSMCEQHLLCPKQPHSIQWALDYKVCEKAGYVDSSTQTWLSHIRTPKHIGGEDPFFPASWGKKIRPAIRNVGKEKADEVRKVMERLFPSVPGDVEVENIEKMVDRGCTSRSIIKFLVMDRLKNYGINLVKELEEQFPEPSIPGNVVAVNPLNIVAQPASVAPLTLLPTLPAPPEIKVTLTDDHIRIQAPPDVIKLLKDSEPQTLQEKHRESQSACLTAAGQALLESVQKKTPEEKSKSQRKEKEKIGKTQENSQERPTQTSGFASADGIQVVEGNAAQPVKGPCKPVERSKPDIKFKAKTPVSKIQMANEGKVAQVQWAVGNAVRPNTSTPCSVQTPLLIQQPFLLNTIPMLTSGVTSIPIIPLSNLGSSAVSLLGSANTLTAASGAATQTTLSCSTSGVKSATKTASANSTPSASKSLTSSSTVTDEISFSSDTSSTSTSVKTPTSTVSSAVSSTYFPSMLPSVMSLISLHSSVSSGSTAVSTSSDAVSSASQKLKSPSATNRFTSTAVSCHSTAVSSAPTEVKSASTKDSSVSTTIGTPSAPSVPSSVASTVPSVSKSQSSSLEKTITILSSKLVTSKSKKSGSARITTCGFSGTTSAQSTLSSRAIASTSGDSNVKGVKRVLTFVKHSEGSSATSTEPLSPTSQNKPGQQLDKKKEVSEKDTAEKFSSSSSTQKLIIISGDKSNIRKVESNVTAPIEDILEALKGKSSSMASMEDDSNASILAIKSGLYDTGKVDTGNVPAMETPESGNKANGSDAKEGAQVKRGRSKKDIKNTEDKPKSDKSENIKESNYYEADKGLQDAKFTKQEYDAEKNKEDKTRMRSNATKMEETEGNTSKSSGRVGRKQKLYVALDDCIESDIVIINASVGKVSEDTGQTVKVGAKRKSVNPEKTSELVKRAKVEKRHLDQEKKTDVNSQGQQSTKRKLGRPKKLELSEPVASTAKTTTISANSSVINVSKTKGKLIVKLTPKKKVGGHKKLKLSTPDATSTDSLADTSTDSLTEGRRSTRVIKKPSKYE